MSAIIGASCRIEGNIDITGDITLLDRSSIGGVVRSGGNITIRPLVQAQALECDGDMEVTGKTHINSVNSGHKITARKC